MKNNSQKLFDGQSSFNLNSTMYTSGLGVVKNSAEIGAMNSGFGTVKERLTGDDQNRRVFAAISEPMHRFG
jgi:hypothetical protein